MSDERIVFVGTIPSIQSAIQISGDGSGRIKIDTPESELSEILKLLLLKNHALRFVVVEEKGQPDETQEQPDTAAPQEHKKAQAGNRWSSLAHLLHVRGYFRAPPLWDAMEKAGLYAQVAHKYWIERQPCWFVAHPGGAQVRCSGPADGGSGDRISVGHHVRTADNSGVAIKPDDWYLLPICDAHHRICDDKTTTREFKEMTLNAAVQITADQMKFIIKMHLKRDSLSGVTKEEIIKFEKFIGYDSHFAFDDAA